MLRHNNNDVGRRLRLLYCINTKRLLQYQYNDVRRRYIDDAYINKNGLKRDRMTF